MKLVNFIYMCGQQKQVNVMKKDHLQVYFVHA